jgi:hypothetical protein
MGCDGARDGIFQMARFRFCLIDLIGGQEGIETAQVGAVASGVPLHEKEVPP